MLSPVKAKRLHPAAFPHTLTLSVCHPLPNLAHTISKGNTFSISSPFDVTKLQQICFDVLSQCQWTRIYISLTPMAMGTYLYLNGIERAVELL